ncbi:MAG: hypothetical protein NWF01_08690 [Candidatus Bathyarchaeota archaeon]|nr:hypothetical protein [Candidatus Bathyarchaeota archaeon]
MQFIKAYVKTKNATLTEQSSPKVFTVKYPEQENPIEYTYDPAVAREKNSLFLAPGSPVFQQILRECLEKGIASQISIKPKGTYEATIKRHFKEPNFDCPDCSKITTEKEKIAVCQKPQPCHHQINNAKIETVNITKKEPLRLFQFYYLAIFQNKLRARNEELITITVNEKGEVIEEVNEDLLEEDTVEVSDHKSKLKPGVFEELKAVADKTLEQLLREKVALFDLPLIREKKSKLKSFDKRIRRARLEQLIQNKADIDMQTWQTNYQALMDREEEALTTHITVKLVNLLIINTSKITAKINLNNKASITASITFGINILPEVTCPICKTSLMEGYATQDNLYVCKNCIHQSIDTGKIYSKKAALKIDETLKEYIEQNEGFVCSVCGKRHSKLLEFKCSHDNSSVCIFHYDLCDVCGRVVSKANLKHNEDFTRKLCPKHAHAKKN